MIAVGLLFVAAGIWADDRQAVSTVLVLFGAAMVIIGALLPRIEGAITVSLREGLKFTLAAQRAAQRKAAERNLSPEKTEQAVVIAIEQAVSQAATAVKSRRLSHEMDAIIAPANAEAIADAAVKRVIDLDAAREERRRQGQDVDNEPLFADIMAKLKSGQALTTHEQSAVDRLVETIKSSAIRITPRGL